jgi:alcohol dehydrogenase class IV
MHEQHPDVFTGQAEQPKPKTADVVAIGTGKGTGSQVGRFTQAQIDAMTPEEYEKNFNLPRKQE